MMSNLIPLGKIAKDWILAPVLRRQNNFLVQKPTQRPHEGYDALFFLLAVYLARVNIELDLFVPEEMAVDDHTLHIKFQEDPDLISVFKDRGNIPWQWCGPVV